MISEDIVPDNTLGLFDVDDDVQRAMKLAGYQHDPVDTILAFAKTADVIRFVVAEKELAAWNESNENKASVKLPITKNIGKRGDAGIDLYAPYKFVCQAGNYVVVNTFLKFYFPDHLYGRILPRGGDKFLVGSGVIDTSYSGDLAILKVRIVNPYSFDIAFEQYDSIGQLVPVLRTSVYGHTLLQITNDELLRLPHSERGGDGRINQQLR